MAIPLRLIDAVEVTESQVHIIRLKNIFDASTVEEFEKVVAYLLARNFYKIVVDLRQVEFISSAGWGAFTAELRRIRENQGDIKLAGMNLDVFDVFLLLELDSFISAYDTVDEAIMVFATPPRPVLPPPARKVPPRVLAELQRARSDELIDEPEQEAVKSGALALHEPLGENGSPDDEELMPEELEVPADTLDTTLPMAANRNLEISSEPLAADDEILSYSSVFGAPSPRLLDTGRELSEDNEIDTGLDEQPTTESIIDSEMEASGYEPVTEENQATQEYDATEYADEATAPSRPAEIYADEPPEEDAYSREAEEFSEADSPELTGEEFSSEAIAEENESPSAEEFAAAECSEATAAPLTTEESYSEEAIDEQDFEFETQDICDPWILDEIDTLPEEDEMNEGEGGNGLYYENEFELPVESDEYYAYGADESGEEGYGVETATSELDAQPQDEYDTPYPSEYDGEMTAGEVAEASEFEQAEAITPHTGEEVTEMEEESQYAARDESIAAAPYAKQDETVPYAASEQRVDSSPLHMNGNLLELIRQIVYEHPHYGPTIIRKFLEVRVEPPVSVSRSTVYRYLREANLNTRAKRLEYAAGRNVSLAEV